MNPDKRVSSGQARHQPFPLDTQNQYREWIRCGTGGVAFRCGQNTCECFGGKNTCATTGDYLSALMFGGEGRQIWRWIPRRLNLQEENTKWTRWPSATRAETEENKTNKTCAQWPRIQQTSVRLDQIEMTAGHTHTTCRPPVCVCVMGVTNKCFRRAASWVGTATARWHIENGRPLSWERIDKLRDVESGGIEERIVWAKNADDWWTNCGCTLPLEGNDWNAGECIIDELCSYHGWVYGLLFPSPKRLDHLTFFVSYLKVDSTNRRNNNDRQETRSGQLSWRCQCNSF